MNAANLTQAQRAATLRTELFESLERVVHYLELRLGAHSEATLEPLPVPSTLAALAAHFGLSPFERDLLLMAAGCELSSDIRALVARAHGDAAKPWLNFQLALELLPTQHWEALTPVAPLRRWQLLELIGSGSILEARIQLDENILHQLLGMSHPDPRLAAWFAREAVTQQPDALLDANIKELATAWQAASSLLHAPVARLSQGDGEAYAHTIASAFGLELYRLTDAELPSSTVEREQLAQLWARQAQLRRGLLWVDAEPAHAHNTRALASFLDSLESLIVITGCDGLRLRRTQQHCERRASDVADRLRQWESSLQHSGHRLNGTLPLVAEQFQLPRNTIVRLGERWASTSDTPEQLWEACRAEARRGLDGLAERVQGRATWDDLILPSAAQQSLRAMVAQVRQRARVHGAWGFAAQSGRGLGISALFAGSSGTGKTLAAEVLANELALDLFRVDLSALVSKYIGETEKNLSRVFAAAESSGAILLFDEADALFGKRSEVRDSHDRYANLEVSYLLQRMETYRGVAILTSNLKQTIDTAFQRRLRFIVTFPFPDAAARSAIWRRAFPSGAPLAELDFGKLSRLSLSGGHIHNLALNAAFLAADEQKAVGMQHLRRAAEAEFSKLDKTLPLSELSDWQ
jgi:hypothetical protein